MRTLIRTLVRTLLRTLVRTLLRTLFWFLTPSKPPFIEGQCWALWTQAPERASKNAVWFSEGSEKVRLGVSVYRVGRNALPV